MSDKYKHHLVTYGYVSGNRAGACRTCGKWCTGVDQDFWRCESCAEAAYQAARLPRQAGKNAPLKGHRDGRIDVYKDTQDDWYPSFRLNDRHDLVRCSFFPLGDGLWRVCVWGNDDAGVERDFDNKDQAKAVWDAVLRMEHVNRDLLEALHFQNA